MRVRNSGLVVLPWEKKPFKPMIRVVHVINGLQIGGAELALLRLVKFANRSMFNMEVVSLIGDGPVGRKLRDAGIQVTCLNMSVSRPSPIELGRLVMLLRRKNPDVVQTWLQQSDLLGGISARLACSSPVLWNIRHSTLHPRYVKLQTRMITKACALLSGTLPAKVVCCSESSRMEQLKLGYCPRKMTVIPNGVDTTVFRPRSSLRLQMRRESGISDRALVIGASGRFHPQKDYRTFIRAAALIANKCPEAEFAICGDAITWDNRELAGWISGSGLAAKFHLLGRTDNMPDYMAALDLFVSSACFGEGFPNVVSEAMACGVPCVVTDVGDSGLIVGDTGRVIPVENPDALAAACLDMLRHPSLLVEYSEKARNRIVDQFSLPRMIDSYEHLYAQVASRIQ